MLALRVCGARRVFALGLGARGIASQSVGNKHAADLFDLLRFRLISVRLQVENLQHVAAGKDVVAASNTLVKAEMTQQCTQIGKRDVTSAVPRSIRSSVFSTLPTRGLPEAHRCDPRAYNTRPDACASTGTDIGSRLMLMANSGRLQERRQRLSSISLG